MAHPGIARLAVAVSVGTQFRGPDTRAAVASSGAILMEDASQDGAMSMAELEASATSDSAYGNYDPDDDNSPTPEWWMNGYPHPWFQGSATVGIGVSKARRKENMRKANMMLERGWGKVPQYYCDAWGQEYKYELVTCAKYGDLHKKPWANMAITKTYYQVHPELFPDALSYEDFGSKGTFDVVKCHSACALGANKSANVGSDQLTVFGLRSYSHCMCFGNTLNLDGNGDKVMSTLDLADMTTLMDLPSTPHKCQPCGDSKANSKTQKRWMCNKVQKFTTEDLGCTQTKNTTAQGVYYRCDKCFEPTIHSRSLALQAESNQCKQAQLDGFDRDCPKPPEPQGPHLKDKWTPWDYAAELESCEERCEYCSGNNDPVGIGHCTCGQAKWSSSSLEAGPDHDEDFVSIYRVLPGQTLAASPTQPYLKRDGGGGVKAQFDYLYRGCLAWDLVQEQGYTTLPGSLVEDQNDKDRGRIGTWDPVSCASYCSMNAGIPLHDGVTIGLRTRTICYCIATDAGLVARKKWAVAYKSAAMIPILDPGTKYSLVDNATIAGHLDTNVGTFNEFINGELLPPMLDTNRRRAFVEGQWTDSKGKMASVLVNLRRGSADRKTGPCGACKGGKCFKPDTPFPCSNNGFYAAGPFEEPAATPSSGRVALCQTCHPCRNKPGTGGADMEFCSGTSSTQYACDYCKKDDGTAQTDGCQCGDETDAGMPGPTVAVYQLKCKAGLDCSVQRAHFPGDPR